MKIRENMYYWEISRLNPEPALDPSYIIDLKVREEHLRAVKQMRRIIKRICGEGRFEDAELLLELDRLLMMDGAQYSEFVAFMNTCDISQSIYAKLEENERIDILKHLLHAFCERRFHIYERLSEDDVCVMQAIMDRGAVRRFAGLGKTKVKDILARYGFKEVEMPSLFYAIRDKLVFDVDRHKRHFTRICSLLGVQRDFKKRPDLMVRIYDHILIIEIKHIKEAGGAQDKQIKELIEFIDVSEPKEENIHYVSFMDGRYANTVFQGQHQYSGDAIMALKRNPNNFFVNTAGFKHLVKDILGSTAESV